MGFTTIVGALPVPAEPEPPRPTFTKEQLALIKVDEAALAEADKGEKGALGKHRAEGGDDDLGAGQELTEIGRDMLASFQEHAVESGMSKAAAEGVLRWWEGFAAEYRQRLANNDAAATAQARKALKA